MERSILFQRLHELGRRVLLIAGGAGCCWGIVAAVLLVLAGAWVDLVWELPPWPRLGVLLLAGLTAVLVLVVLVARAMRQRSPRYLAARLDAARRARGRISAGVDLALEPTYHSPLSASLAALAVQEAQDLSRGVGAERVIPAKPLQRSLLALGGLALAVLILALAWPALARAQWLRFADPYGDHPPYTSLSFQVEPGHVAVVYGTGLNIMATIDGETVDRTYLVLQGPDGAEESLPMFPESKARWRGTLTQVTEPRRYWIRTSAGRSRKFDLNVITIPRLESVRFRITPPAYANLGSYDGSLPQGGLAGLRGTQVQVRARSNRPLSAGELRLGDGPPIIMKPTADGSQEVTGVFEIHQPGKVALKVIDVAGQHSTEVFQAPIIVLPDERPFVRVIEPPALSLATPTSALPIVLAAEDDYGISRLQLFRSLNDSRALPVDIELPTPAPVRWSASLILPLAAYGLEAGDEIKLFARVEDNDPAGAKGFETPVAVVRIISQEEFERMVRVRHGLAVLTAKYQQAQRRLEALADDAERLRKKAQQQKELSQEAKDDLAKLAKRLRQDAAAVRKSASQPFPYDIDEALTKHLEKLAQELEEAAEQAERLTREKQLTGPRLDQEMAKLLGKLGQNRQQLEREAMEPLRQLEQVYPLIEDASRFIELVMRQKSLAERLASLKDKERSNDPAERARMRDLQNEQQEIRQALNQLLEDIENHVKRLPDDPEVAELRKTALEFVDKVRSSGAIEAMADAEAGLADFNGKRGHAGAQKAAELLEKLLDMCDSEGGIMGLGQAKLRFQPGIGDTIRQLLGEAGLPTGRGQGTNGQSARRNSMDNVGLFGNLPALGESDGDGQSPRNQAGLPGSVRPGGVRDWSRPAGSDAATNQQVPAGAAEGSVPLPYRRRVAEYLQRLAEELNGK